MAGGAYIVIALCFGLAGGVVGKIKGSSFWLWFSISGAIPVIGLLAAVLLPLRARRAAPPVPDVRARRASSTTRCACAAGPSSSSPRRRSRRSRRLAALTALAALDSAALAGREGRPDPAERRSRHACGRCHHGVPEGGGCRRRIRPPRRRQPPDLRRVRRRAASATSSCATRPAAATPPRATRRRPARSASRSRTSGPGATNVVTPIVDAMMDSVPTVFITGQVRTDLLGTDGFQETDTLGITMPVVKHSFMIRAPAGDPARDPRGVPPRAHRPARPGRRRHPAGPLARGHRLRAGHRRAPARLPADDRRQHEADPPGGEGAGVRAPAR